MISRIPQWTLVRDGSAAPRPGAFARPHLGFPWCAALARLFHHAAIFLAVAAATGAETPPNRAEAIAALTRQERAFADVPFPEVVLAATGHRVLSVDPVADEALIRQVSAAIDRAIAALNDPAHPIHHATRINEASRYVEDELAAEFNRVPGWRCGVPQTEAGTHQRSGYPDLVLTLPDQSTVYIDPKLVAPDQFSSTLRTFYYQPKTETNKVTRDARHLLVGILHNDRTGPALRLDSWHLVDLAKIRVRLKAEFQASNNDVYQAETIIAKGTGAGKR